LQPLSSSYHESGWPRWAFFATIPFVLALGLIAGMAVATYTADGPAIAQPQQAAETPQQQRDPAQPPVASPPPQSDSSWQIPAKPGLNASQPPPETLPLTPHPWSGSDIVPAPPARTPIDGPPADAAEAAIALAGEFGTYSKGTASLHVDYQQMRQSGQGVTVVGLIRAAAYPDWAKALRENPDQLAAWLQLAAARVQSAAIQERFFVSWSVVDVTQQRPAEFGDHEITPLSDGTYLVIRPLAATVDYAKTEISLRPLASLLDAASGLRTAPDAPWATYGPALHFDSTDIYRPVPLGAKPVSR
jgi:hypothetical protein